MKVLVVALQCAAIHGWRSRASMPKAMSDFSATAVDDDAVIIVGGCDDHQVACDWWDGCSYCPSLSQSVFKYSASQNAWSELAAMPRERYRHAAALDASTGLLYVVGGRDVDDALIEEVDVYDVASDAWTTAAFTVARSDLGAVFRGDGALLVAGGYDVNYTAYASTSDIDVATGAMSAGPALLEARGDFGLVKVGDEVVYAVGGWSDADWCAPLASVEVLDLTADGAAFEAAPDLLVARGDKALAATDDGVYVVGGEHNNGCDTGSTPVDDVEMLDKGGSEWETVRKALPEERFRTAAAAVDDYLFVFGGQSAESESCEGFDYCYPVTDHVWRISTKHCHGANCHTHGDDDDMDDDEKRKFEETVAFAAILAVAVFALFLIVVGLVFKAYCAKGPQGDAEAKVPIKDGDVELQGKDADDMDLCADADAVV